MSGILGALFSPLSFLEHRVRRGEARLLALPARGKAGMLLRILQVLVLARRRCVEDHVGDRAAALAFSTLLSLLPLLLVALAGLSLLGYPAETLTAVEAWLFATFVPDVAHNLSGFIHRSLASLLDASRSLGATGIVLLILAASNLLNTLARAFSRIWGPAGFLPTIGRIAGFWATVIGGPVLVAISLLITAELEQVAGSPGILRRTVDIAGFALVALASYFFLPGKRVRLLPAMFGALVAGLLFDLLKRGFAAYLRHAFVASTVLAGLGVLPIFLLWVWFAWVVFLLGAECVWCAQEFEAARIRHAPADEGGGDRDRAGAAGHATG